MLSDRTALRTRTVDLGHEQMLVIDDRPGTRVDVLLGGVWLTEERCWQDRFAGAGEWLRVESSGRAVVEAIGPTRIEVDGPERMSWRARARRALRSPSALLVPQLAAALAAVALGLGLPEVLGRSVAAEIAAAELVRSTAASIAATTPEAQAGADGVVQGAAAPRISAVAGDPAAPPMRASRPAPHS